MTQLIFWVNATRADGGHGARRRLNLGDERGDECVRSGEQHHLEEKPVVMFSAGRPYFMMLYKFALSSVQRVALGASFLGSAVAP